MALLGSIVIALAMLLWTWQLGAHRRANVALTKGEEYRRLAEEYRRLAEMAVTAQEHTDLKLGEVTTRIDQVRDQLESVQRVLADVE